MTPAELRKVFTLTRTTLDWIDAAMRSDKPLPLDLEMLIIRTQQMLLRRMLDGCEQLMTMMPDVQDIIARVDQLEATIRAQRGARLN
jgi:hypothetical protein